LNYRRPLLGPIDIAALAGLVQLLLVWLILKRPDIEELLSCNSCHFHACRGQWNLAVTDDGSESYRGQRLVLRCFLAVVVMFAAVVILAAKRENGEHPWLYAEYVLLLVGASSAVPGEPGRRHLTVAYVARRKPASLSTRRLSSLLVGSMMRASTNRPNTSSPLTACSNPSR